jgi:hypothetical protein
MPTDPDLVPMPEKVRLHLEELAVAQALAEMIRRWPVSAPKVILEMAAVLRRQRPN